MHRFITSILLALTLIAGVAGAQSTPRDIRQSQLDIQAHELVYATPFASNINADDRCAPSSIFANSNVGVCSDEYYSWTPGKDYLITKVVVVVQKGASVDAGQCRLSLWTDDFTDAFATQIGSNMDFDALVADGTTYSFSTNIQLTEFIPLGIYFEDDDQAGTCTSIAGNDADVRVYLYGRATN